MKLVRASVEITVFDESLIWAVTNRKYGKFSCPGGKVEDGEDFDAAARRELMEETGCEARKLLRVAGNLLTFPQADDPGEWFCMGYLADVGTQRPREVEKGTMPFLTTKEDLLQNSLYPEWYRWWFDLLEKVKP